MSTDNWAEVSLKRAQVEQETELIKANRKPDRMPLLMSALAGLAAFVAFMYVVTAMWLTAAHSTDSDERVARDRVAACVTAVDVVGCLKETR